MARETDNIRRRNQTPTNFIAARVNADFRTRELLFPYLLVSLNLSNSTGLIITQVNQHSYECLCNIGIMGLMRKQGQKHTNKNRNTHY